jgi:hypothetical protein
MEGPIPTPSKQRRTPQRRTLSCLPCREFKVKCNRQIPCDSCIRYGRERQCQTHPSPACLETTTLTYPKRLKKTDKSQMKRPSGNPSIQKSPVAMLRDRISSYVSSGITPDLRLDRTQSEEISPHSSSAYQTVASFSMRSVTKTLHSSSETRNLQSSICHFVPPFMAEPNGSLDELLHWRTQLAGNLPTRTQCDFLSSYFFENINWIYQVLHIPSFRKQNSAFWSSPVAEIDLIWLSLLYTVISASALYLPAQLAEAMSFEATKMRNFSRAWHSLSRQCLHAGGYESNACLVQLQTFLISQLYWLATKDVETLNS